MDRALYRPDIDGLRAVSVGLVVLEHADLAFPGGFIGVDVFFVISGFLITRLIVMAINENSFSLKEFWLRRLRRILPAAALVVAATLAAGMLILRPGELTSLAESAVAQQLLSANLFYWNNTGYFDLPSRLKPLLHTWSLAVEEQFYLVWPLVLLFVKRSRSALMVATCILGIGSLIFSVWATTVAPSFAFYWTPPRVWEFVIGAGIVFLPKVGGSRLPNTPLPAVAGLLLILVPAATYSSFTEFPGISAIAPCLGAALIIGAPSKNWWSVTGLLSFPPLVYLGRASYSIYLWNWPLLVFARLIAGRLPFAAQVAIALAGVAAGCLTYEFVETPFRSRRWVPDDKKFVRLAGLSVIALCSVGLGINVIMRFQLQSVSGLGVNNEPPYRSPFNPLNPLKPLAESDQTILVPYPNCAGLAAVLGESGMDARGPAFVLWGDSHAAAIAPLCDRLARSRGIWGPCVSVGGWVPLVGVWHDAGGKDGKQVQLKWNSNVVEWIESHQVRHIIVAARWDTKVPSTEIEIGPEDRDSGLLRDVNSVVVSRDDARRVFADGLRKTVSHFSDRNVKIWFLMQVPVLQGRSPLGVTRSDYEQQQQIREVLDEFPSMHLIVVGSANNWFDDQGISRTVDGTTNFYLDDHHLNNFGAERLMGTLLESVFDIIAKE